MDEALIDSLRVGDHPFLFYDPADGFWHERILLLKGEGARPTVWCCVTADGDIYEEDLADAQRVLRGGPQGGLPWQVRGQPTVRFAPFTREDLARWQRIARAAVGADLEEGRVLPAAVEAPLPPPVGPAAAPPGPAAMSNTAWVAMEERGGYKAGDTFLGVVVHQAQDRGLGQAADGMVLAIAESGSLPPAPGPAGIDLRVLPLVLDKHGRRA